MIVNMSKREYGSKHRASAYTVLALLNKNEKLLIETWREERGHAPYRPYVEFISSTITLDILRSFLQNINLMVLIHLAISLASVYIFQRFNISFECNVALFVSPIVFPLAFSINSDYQRREKVLEDLASFKSAGISWYFIMRELKNPADLDTQWVQDIHLKLKKVLYYLCEYLLTGKADRRKVILRAIYDTFSDAYELVEMLRARGIPTLNIFISKLIHLLHQMGLSFERLRVIRDYRSPRSIRSFNKLFILLMPIILGPYFVHVGEQSENHWQSYYLAAILPFVFSTLQAVQDKLDDPFDGMGEDDINFDILDEWTPILVPNDRTLTTSRTLSQRFKEPLQPPYEKKESKDILIESRITKHESLPYIHHDTPVKDETSAKKDDVVETVFSDVHIDQTDYATVYNDDDACDDDEMR